LVSRVSAPGCGCARGPGCDGGSEGDVPPSLLAGFTVPAVRAPGFFCPQLRNFFYLFQT
jgi:hypothetical protein